MPDALKAFDLRLGDCLDGLRGMEAESVDSIVTDPPAGIFFMNSKWDSDKGGRDSWIAWMAGIAAECLRVIKPGGHALVWALPRTSHWTATAWENGGWEIRDRIGYLHGQGFPKNLDMSKAIDREAGAKRERNVIPNKRSDLHGSRPWMDDPDYRFQSNEPITAAAKQWEGFGTALKPAVEDWWLCRKPLSEKTVAANVQKYGTGGINVDGCRIPHNGNISSAKIERSPKTKGILGKFKNNEGKESWSPDNSAGRWPAHLCHDGSEEVLKVFPETESGAKFIVGGTPRKTDGFICSGSPDRTNAIMNFGDSGSAARFFQCCPQDKICSICRLTGIGEYVKITEKKGGLSCLKNAKNADENLSQITGTTSNDFVQGGVQPLQLQENGGKEEPSNENASFADNYIQPLQVEKRNFAQQNARENQYEKFVRLVKSAGNLCETCATVIVQNIVAMRQGRDPELVHGWGFINERKKQILTQCLASFAALLGNTDTIPTMESLNLLFGSVFHAIGNYTEKINEKTEKETCQQSRIKYCSKASPEDRNYGCERLEEKKAGKQAFHSRDGRNTKSRNHHPTVKATALMRWLCRLITPPGGLILDPFMGSGSTGKAAMLERFRFIGIEIDPEYLEIARARIGRAQADEQAKLF